MAKSLSGGSRVTAGLVEGAAFSRRFGQVRPEEPPLPQEGAASRADGRPSARVQHSMCRVDRLSNHSLLFGHGSVGLKEGVLHVGASGAKNDPSERFLPVPSVVMELVGPLVSNKSGEESLLGFIGSDGAVASGFSRSIKDAMCRADRDLHAKSLRKSFATICLNELGAEPAQVEGFLGHKHPGATAVTRRDYLKRAGAGSLMPLAEMLDRAFGCLKVRDSSVYLPEDE